MRSYGYTLAFLVVAVVGQSAIALVEHDRADRAQRVVALLQREVEYHQRERQQLQRELLLCTLDQCNPSHEGHVQSTPAGYKECRRRDDGRYEWREWRWILEAR